VTRRQLLAGAVTLPALAASHAERDRVEILPVPGGGIQPQVAGSGGALHLIYLSGDPKHADVFYARSNDFGRGFSPPARVNSAAGSAIAIGSIRGAQIAVGQDQRVHVAWNGSGNSPHFPMLYARLGAGGEFEPQRNLMRTTFGLDGGGSVAADESGNVYVAWHGKSPGAPEGEAGRQVWIAQSGDDGRTFAPERAATDEPTGACGCCGMRIFADARGGVYGLYRSATQNVHRDIWLMRSADRGRSFSADRLHPWEIDACPMSSMAFTEARGEVFGAWETQGQIYFAPLSRGIEAARRAITAPPGADRKRKYPALAGNARGEILLAWVEGAGWQRGGTLGWQIFDSAGRPLAAAGSRTDVPVWSFPAAFARPGGGFGIIV
jgi:hypothetical protein